MSSSGGLDHSQPNCHPEPEWWEYRSERYVERTEVESQLIDWLATSSPKHPIRSLMGPPGVGKSWLMAHLPTIIRASDGNERRRFVWPVDAKRFQDPDRHSELKSELITEATRCCTDLELPGVESSSLSRTIEEVRDQLCARRSLPHPVVLIDGCDDLPDPDKVQSEYFARFYEGNADCFRMVFALRYADLLYYKLKERHEMLSCPVFSDPETDANKQMARLLNVQEEQVSLASLLPAQSHYRWNHPYINAFLLAQHRSGRKITSKTLIDCCLCLINRPQGHNGNTVVRYPPMTAEKLNMLLRLARLGEWNNMEFNVVTGSQANEEFFQGILAKTETNNYTFVDGLREILRDLVDLRERGE